MVLSKNQVASSPSQWVCPSDRNLTLRAKLNSGWSSRSSSMSHYLLQQKINTKEVNRIQQVLQRASTINSKEKQRIGAMINRVEGESKKILGSGNDDCLSCAEPFGILFFGQQPIYCFVCNKKFCHKCCTDFTATRMHRLKHHEAEAAGAKSKEDNRRICRVCCEKRELWKRSGAWFYNGLPPFISIKCNGQEQSNFNSNPIIDLPDHNVYGHHPTGSFLSLSSSSEFSESETSSSSRHTHTRMGGKKRHSKWRRKFEVPLIKKIKLKKGKK